MNQDSFYPKLEDERCRAKLPGCTNNPEIRIHCNTEGTDVTVCRNCSTVWRLNARPQGLYDRCPMCASWRPEYVTHRQAPAAPPILQGPAADAVEAAMHAEGLLLDVRTKVLRRLAKDAQWLFTAAPDDPETMKINYFNGTSVEVPLR